VYEPSGMHFLSSVDTLHEAKVHRRAERWFRCSSFKSAFRPIKKAPQRKTFGTFCLKSTYNRDKQIMYPKY